MEPDRALVADLTPTAEALLERHLSTAREWFPHELVPWSRGRDFEPGEQFDPEVAGLPAEVRSALFVNLLTEDNLPYYFNLLDRLFGADSVWGVWARRWTAEEMRHAMVMRDYLTVTRAIDPVGLERARMVQVAGGVVPQPGFVADGFVYVALQELATRVSHHNTGKALLENDRAGYEVMKRVAADENLHFLFYRDLVTAALEVDASAMVCAIERQVRGFEMPGTGIPDFAVHAKAIAQAGIYDYAIHHDQILIPVVLRHWKLESLEGLSPDAEVARTRALRQIDRIGRAGRRFAARRDERAAALARPSLPPNPRTRYGITSGSDAIPYRVRGGSGRRA
jgi:acyl-[acyl-carrier-protein] desaturase